jgi:hypothetical protein
MPRANDNRKPKMKYCDNERSDASPPLEIHKHLFFSSFFGDEPDSLKMHKLSSTTINRSSRRLFRFHFAFRQAEYLFFEVT